MQQVLTARHSGKTKQITNWSVSAFKGKLKFFRFKTVKYKTRAFNRKIEIKFHSVPRTITYNVVVFFFFRPIFRVLCTISPAML